VIDFMAPEVGLEPTTLRLTGQAYRLESQCYQWSRAELKGRFGALSAPNSARNSAKFFDEMNIRLQAEDSSPQPAFWKPGRGQNAMRNRLAAEYQSQSPGKLERQSDAKPNALHPESLRQDVLWRARVEVV
jgi:hypothetical protein